MGLADSLKKLGETRIRQSNEICAYQLLLNSMTKDDQKALEMAWEKGYPVAEVITILRREGHKTSSTSVNAHRKGICKCPKK